MFVHVDKNTDHAGRNKQRMFEATGQVVITAGADPYDLREALSIRHTDYRSGAE